jgi:hypothetical protein
MTAQRKRARNVGGTMMPLARKRRRSFCIGINDKIVCSIQYRKKQSKPPAIRFILHEPKFI